MPASGLSQGKFSHPSQKTLRHIHQITVTPNKMSEPHLPRYNRLKTDFPLTHPKHSTPNPSMAMGRRIIPMGLNRNASIHRPFNKA
jgi:hypothetical protein